MYIPQPTVHMIIHNMLVSGCLVETIAYIAHGNPPRHTRLSALSALHQFTYSKTGGFNAISCNRRRLLLYYLHSDGTLHADHLNSDSFENSEAADDGDVEGRQGKGELVHHVAQLADHVLEVEFPHGGVQHVRKCILGHRHKTTTTGVEGTDYSPMQRSMVCKSLTYQYESYRRLNETDSI